MSQDCESIRNVADTDTVMVKRMTQQEAMALFTRYTGRQVVPVQIFRDLGLIKPDLTPSDRFKSAHPEWELLDRSDLVDKVLAWAKEQKA